MAQRIRGEGSVYWSSSQDRYAASYLIGHGEGGKPIRRVLYGPRGDRSIGARSGVVMRLDALVAQNPRGASQETIEGYVAAHIARAPLRTKTRFGYEKLLGRYIKGTTFGAKRLNEMTPRDARAFLDGLKVGIPTRNAVRALLHAVCEAAMMHDDLGANPIARVARKRVERVERQVWEPEQVLHFLRTARSHRLYGAFVLAVTCGMGPAEVFGLQRSSVSLTGRYLSVRHDLVEAGGALTLEEPKNAFRVRRIDLPKIAVDALRERFEAIVADGHARSGYVFTSPDGHPIRLSNFHRRVWVPLIEKAELPRIRLYDLRHCANALWGFLGVPIQVAKERMGHSSIQQTVDTYGHNYGSMGREVATKLDGFFTGFDDPTQAVQSSANTGT